MKYISLFYLSIYLSFPEYLKFLAINDSWLYFISLIAICFMLVSNLLFKALALFFTVCLIYMRSSSFQQWLETTPGVEKVMAMFFEFLNAF